INQNLSGTMRKLMKPLHRLFIYIIYKIVVKISYISKIKIFFENNIKKKKKMATDCLNEILEHLEEDKITLHSCLLVNRLWCEISVRILWRNIFRKVRTFEGKKSILSTLITCLPN